MTPGEGGMYMGRGEAAGVQGNGDQEAGGPL